MTEAAAPETEPNRADADATTRRDAIRQLGAALDGWRAKIDELLVQLDLVDLDLRDELRKRVSTAENVYLAARSQLSNAQHDAGSDLRSLRAGLEQLGRDLRNAYDAAEAVVRRAREE